MSRGKVLSLLHRASGTTEDSPLHGTFLSAHSERQNTNSETTDFLLRGIPNLTESEDGCLKMHPTIQTVVVPGDVNGDPSILLVANLEGKTTHRA